MNKSWMTLANRYGKEYRKGVDDFIKFAKQRVGTHIDMRCPCIECGNLHRHSIKVITFHLVKHGISPTYTIWKYHGETGVINQQVESTSRDLDDETNIPGHHIVDDNELPNMLQDVYMSTFSNEDLGDLPSETGDFHKFCELLDDARRELYTGCKSFSVLSFVVKIFSMKVSYKWSDRCFDALMQLFKDLLPECDKKVPWTLYETKKFLRDLGLGYEPIHACKYDCALFWKENANLQNCPVCDEPRYELDKGEGKKIPRKVLRYFPLTPRLKRLYGSRKTAISMRWHKDKREDDGVLRHPADGKEWKNFALQHPDFSKEARNVVLGLSTDGFNPFGNMSNAYSLWPVIVTPYNLPPWMCMKEPFCMMSLLIPGPVAPGRDIDVYMRPLNDELKELWEIGVPTHDASIGKVFQMRAAVIWTKLGGNWKVVERLRRRGLWNIPERECADVDDAGISTLKDVFQQDETFDIDSIVVGDLDDSTLLARHDVEAEIIPDEVVMQSRKIALLTDDDFLNDNDDESEEQYSGDEDDETSENPEYGYDEFELSFSH